MTLDAKSKPQTAGSNLPDGSAELTGAPVNPLKPLAAINWDDEADISERVRSLRANKQFGELEKLVHKALEKFPKNAEIRFQRGLAYYEQQQYDKAVEAFNETLEIIPKHEVVTEWKLRALRLGKQYDSAQKLADETLALFPQNVEFLSERGLLHYDQEEYDQAAETLDRAIKSGADRELEWLWKLTSLRLATRYLEAEKVADEARKKFPKAASILNERALLYYSQKQYDKAIEAFDESLAADPKNEFAWTWKLTSLRALMNLDGAEKVFKEALAKLPKSASILSEKALWHSSKKQFAKAIEVFDEVLQADPDNVFAWIWKLAALRGDHQYKRAEQLFDEALKKFPKNDEILTHRGLLHYDLKQFEQAATVLAEAVAINEGNDVAVRWRLASLRALASSSSSSTYRELEKELNSAIERLPNSVELLQERGFLLYDRGRFGEAVEAFDKVLRADQRNENGFIGKIDSLRASRRVEEAAAATKEALALLPESTLMLDEQGAVFYAQKRYDKAIAAFDQVLAVGQPDIFAVQVKILSLRAMASDQKPEKLEDAEKFIEEVLKLVPKTPELMIAKAWIYFDRKRFDEANDLFEEALALDPNNLALVSSQVDFLTKSNRPDKALDLLLRLKDAQDNRPEVAEQLGFFYLGRSSYTDAEKEFRLLIDERAARAHDGLGRVYLYRRDYDSAEQHFRAACEAEPKDPVLATNLAWALVRGGKKSDFEEARLLCRSALKLDAGYAPALGCLGVMSFKEGCLREAEEYLRESARVGRNEGNFTELGALYLHMGKHNEALEALTTALKNNPNDLQAHIELGNLHLQTDRTSDAIREFRQAVAIGPDNPDCHRALAIALMKAEDLDEAENVLRGAIKRLDKGKRWQLHLTLAQLLTKRGDKTEQKYYYEEALGEVKSAIDLKNDRAEAFLHSGIIHYKLEEYVRAWLDFKESLRLDPENYQAERNKRLVKDRLLKEKSLHLGSILGGFFLAIICLVQLTFLWQRFLVGAEISEKMLLVLIPLLLGLFVIAFLLPGLVRLRLPGFEAELSQPKPSETISSGPKGDVGFGSSLPPIKSGSI